MVSCRTEMCRRREMWCFSNHKCHGETAIPYGSCIGPDCQENARYSAKVRQLYNGEEATLKNELLHLDLEHDSERKFSIFKDNV